MIYLASPYTHKDPKVMASRMEEVCKIAAKLIREGHIIFCPIAHTVPLAKYGLPHSWEFWEKQDVAFLEVCDTIIVCDTIEGWDESVGVRDEVKIMKSMGKKVKYYSDLLKKKKKS